MRSTSILNLAYMSNLIMPCYTETRFKSLNPLNKHTIANAREERAFRDSLDADVSPYQNASSFSELTPASRAAFCASLGAAASRDNTIGMQCLSMITRLDELYQGKLFKWTSGFTGESWRPAPAIPMAIV